MSRNLRLALASAALAALLAACGGGGADTEPRVAITSVKVMGDSLADVGTFGLKFTVQGADSLTYSERVPLAYGLPAGCPFFLFDGSTFIANPAAGCVNYAIGGGVINPASSGLAPTDPRAIGVQLATAVAAGNHGANDLLLIDGGGNDAAALVGAYLAASGDGGASYLALLGTVLTPEQVQAAAGGGAAGLANAGGQYMTALAASFSATLRAQALDKGATRIALLNIPTITNTPRFQAVLGGIEAQAGSAARAQSEQLFRGWVAAFNAELARQFAGDARVAIVDLATAFDEQIADGAQFGITNNRDTACPVTGLGSDGLPTYDFATCTAAALSANPPAGATGGADWWKTWYFSDGFHPTPYGHQLAFQLISRTLARAGWL
ncbi:MAG: SGNH/GDSL hydrolase family protein [Rubrivivax sp.]